MLYSSDLLKSRQNINKVKLQTKIERNYFTETLELSTSNDNKVVLYNEKDTNFYRDYIEYLVKDINDIISEDKRIAQINILKNLVTTSDKFKTLYKYINTITDSVNYLPSDFTMEVNKFNPGNLEISDTNKKIISDIISINNHINRIIEIINMVNNSYSGNKLYSELLDFHNGVIHHENEYCDFDDTYTITKGQIVKYLNDFKYFIIDDGILKKVNNEYTYLIMKINQMKPVIDMIPSLQNKDYDSIIVDKYSSMLKSHIDSIHTLFEDIKNCLAFDNKDKVKYCYTIIDVLYDVYKSIDSDDIVISYTDDDIETELEAVLFLANLELNQDAAYIDYIRESTGLIALQEAEGINMMKYIAKISKGISTVFDKFSKGIDKATENIKKKINDGLDKLDSKIAKLDNPGFTIENYPNFNFDRIEMIKVKDFSYEQMKPNLATVEKYMKFYYPQVYTFKEGVSVSKAFKEYFMNGTTNLKVTKETLLEMTSFIRNDFGKYKENIKADIAVINKANEAISNLSKSTGNTSSEETNQSTPKTDTSTSTPGAKPMTDVNAQAYMDSGIAIIEAEENKNAKFVDDADRKSPEGANNSTLKDVQVYMSVSTSLISAKMSIVIKRLTLSVRTIIHAFTAPKKNKTEEK